MFFVVPLSLNDAVYFSTVRMTFQSNTHFLTAVSPRLPAVANVCEKACSLRSSTHPPVCIFDKRGDNQLKLFRKRRCTKHKECNECNGNNVQIKLFRL